MKKVLLSICSVFVLLLLTSCLTIGSGGAESGAYGRTSIDSDNRYELVPTGDRISYTIDISTKSGKQKLYGKSLSEAKKLAETEAIRKYNCDRLIDPRFDYLKKGGKILRITVDGRPGVYKSRGIGEDYRNRQEIDIRTR